VRTDSKGQTSDVHRDVVVVGAGQAGGEIVTALRAAGHTGRITLVGDEVHLPYSRPPLSKGYLLGEATVDDLVLRPASTYADLGVEVVRGRRVTAIDRDRRVVTLDDGTALPYGDLVLATGGRARRLPLDGADAPNVHCVRTIEDVDGLRADLGAGRRLLVVGGGYVGLEIGSMARRLGMEVTVVEIGSRLLGRVASAETAAFFDRVHREEGVEVLTSTRVVELHHGADGRVGGVTLSDGRTVEVDAVLVGVGLVPNDDLAQDAGLAVDDGVLVDEHFRTSDPRVFAVGDVARFPLGDGHARLESTPNAAEQARQVADVLTGRDRGEPVEPWFWSEQFGIKLQVVGLYRSTDIPVVRGGLDGRTACVFYLRDGEIRAADVAGDPKSFALARKLVSLRARIDPAVLADSSMPLRDLLRPVAA
jgi:3-phenylpropionate/trans-cinnamate dioxygenase ferredoxin reductase subunit